MDDAEVRVQPVARGDAGKRESRDDQPRKHPGRDTPAAFPRRPVLAAVPVALETLLAHVCQSSAERRDDPELPPASGQQLD